MRKLLLIKDVWALRLSGLCAALGFLLLTNFQWQPQAHLPELEPAGKLEAQSAGEKGAEPDTPHTDVAAAAAVQALPKRDVKPLPAYSATVQRPLFQATRRPAPVKPKVAKAPPKPKAPPRSNLTGIRLTGIILTAEKAFGLLSLPGQSELMRARVGQVVKGWKVVDVRKEALLLNNGETDFRMALWKEKPGQSAVPAAHRKSATGHPGTTPRREAPRSAGPGGRQ